MSILDEVNPESPTPPTGHDGDPEVPLEDLKRDLCFCKAELEKRADRIEALERENDALRLHRRSKQTSGVAHEDKEDGPLAEAASINFSSPAPGFKILLLPSFAGTTSSSGGTCGHHLRIPPRE